MSLMIAAAERGSGRRVATPPAIPPAFLDEVSTMFGVTPYAITGGKEIKINNYDPVTPDGYNQGSQHQMLVRFTYSDDLDIVYKFAFTEVSGFDWLSNWTVNLLGKYLIPIASAIDTNLNQAHAINGSGDTTCPMQIMGQNQTNNDRVGGNHGFASVDVPFASPTDKTFDDCGSKWQCSNGHYWYLIQRATPQSLKFISENIATGDPDDFSYKLVTDMGTTLTHVSGATHTSSMATNTAGGPVETECRGLSSGKSSAKFFIDGVEVSLFTDQHIIGFSSFMITQKLLFYWPFDVPAFMIANRPHTTWPLAGGTPWYTQWNLFNFQTGGRPVIHHKPQLHKKIRVMGIFGQQEPWLGGVLGVNDSLDIFPNTALQYIPHMLTYNDGASDYNYREGNNPRTHPFNATYGVETMYYENGIPPINMFHTYANGSVDSITFNHTDHIGVLRVFSGTDDAVKSNGNRTPVLFGTQKWFGRVWAPSTVLANGAYFSLPPFQNTDWNQRYVFYVFDELAPTDGSICKSIIPLGDDVYFRQYFKGVCTPDPLPTYAGKTATIEHISANISVSGTTITVADSNPGYLEIKYS